MIFKKGSGNEDRVREKKRIGNKVDPLIFYSMFFVFLSVTIWTVKFI